MGQRGWGGSSLLSSQEEEELKRKWGRVKALWYHIQTRKPPAGQTVVVGSWLLHVCLTFGYILFWFMQLL